MRITGKLSLAQPYNFLGSSGLYCVCHNSVTEYRDSIGADEKFDFWARAQETSPQRLIHLYWLETSLKLEDLEEKHNCTFQYLQRY
ncbi:hypothetical protein PNOK_0510800 [Pyrrhoderma noxium]|uniref:Uncharacterized protein n=1 Tax=Pyrrhoderma noxium TaxID=2282107 RepID=A0A286UL02_9AGAM|nr:hypothetical protein PNOK_0510800 [Pyrrhoderma noxium]